MIYVVYWIVLIISVVFNGVKAFNPKQKDLSYFLYFFLSCLVLGISVVRIFI